MRTKCNRNKCFLFKNMLLWQLWTSFLVKKCEFICLIFVLFRMINGNFIQSIIPERNRFGIYSKICLFEKLKLLSIQTLYVWFLWKSKVTLMFFSSFSQFCHFHTILIKSPLSLLLDFFRFITFFVIFNLIFSF